MILMKARFVNNCKVKNLLLRGGYILRGQSFAHYCCCYTVVVLLIWKIMLFSDAPKGKNFTLAQVISLKKAFGIPVTLCCKINA